MSAAASATSASCSRKSCASPGLRADTGAPFRYIEDRREHLVAGANSRQHHYGSPPMRTSAGRLQGARRRDHHRRRRLFQLAVHGRAWSRARRSAICRGRTISAAIAAGRAASRPTSPGFLPYRGVARTGVCFAMELMMDAIAREVGRDPWEVRHENLVPASAMPTTMSRASITTAATISRALSGRARSSTWRRGARARSSGEPDGRRIGIGFATYCEQSAHGTSVFAAWGLPVIPATTRPRCG